MTNIDPEFLRRLEALFRQAQAAKGQGDFGGAVGHYEQALELTLGELSRSVSTSALAAIPEFGMAPVANPDSPPAGPYPSCPWIETHLALDVDGTPRFCAFRYRNAAGATCGRVKIAGPVADRFPLDGLLAARHDSRLGLLAGASLDCGECPQRAVLDWPKEAYPIRYLTLGQGPADGPDATFDLLGVLFDLLRRRLLDPTGMVTWAEGANRLPDFEAASRMLGHYGVAQWISGDGLNPSPAIEAVLNSRHGGVEILLDAGCRDTYRAGHGRDQFEQVWGQVRRYAGLAPLVLTYRIGEHNHSQADLEGFLALYREIGCRTVSIAPEEGAAGQLSDSALRACASLIRALRDRGTRVDPGCQAEWQSRFQDQADRLRAMLMELSKDGHISSSSPAGGGGGVIGGEVGESGALPKPFALTPATPDHRVAVSVEPRLRFLHIPKTAGSTFQDCLTRLYPGEPFVFTGDHEADPQRWRGLPPETRRAVHLVCGHAARITGLDEIDGLPTLCFLREPLARVRSFCGYVSEGKSNALLERFPPDRFDLGVFVASDVVELDNLHARMLLARGNLEDVALDDPAAPSRAFEVLADLTAFGLVERFDESLMLFRRQLGWTAWPVYQRLNVRGDRHPLRFEAHHLDTLRRRNAVDLVLYALALPLFEQRLAACVPDLAFQLMEFEDHQGLFARVLRAAMASGAGI